MAQQGNEKIARLLIRHKADLEARGYDGRTALIHAAARGHATAVELLLINNGADVDSKDVNSFTALSLQ
jgi:ankyrin repeat protein